MTAARKKSAKGKPNRKRTWVAPTVPRLAVKPRWVALRTVCAAAAMIVKSAHQAGSSIARLLGGHRIVHVHIARDLPAVGERIVDHPGLVDDGEAAALERGRELVWRNEPVPPMGAPREPAQHVFRANDRQRKALERAIDGRHDEDSAWFHQLRTLLEEQGHVGDVLDHLHCEH